MVQKRTYWLRMSGLLALIVLLLSSCGESETTSNPGPVKGGSIVDAIQEDPDTLLPMLTNEQYYAEIVDQAIWAPLWYTDPNGALLPGIATAPASASSDLKSWTFHLRSGLKWSDGSPETAADCVYSFNLYANPHFGNTSGFPTTDSSDPIGFVSATATDSTTVVLKIKNPYIAMNSLLADGVGTCLQQAHYSTIQPANFATSPENMQPTVTNGPFMIKERVGDHITVVRNPNYYQAPEKPYLDQITFKIITDRSVVLTALQSGQIDTAWGLDYTRLASYKALDPLRFETGIDKNPASFEVIAFNLQNPILDSNVRKALTMSFDTTNLINTLYHGAAVLTCDDHGGTWAHEANLVPCYKVDVSAANALLDADGWNGPRTSDGYRTKAGKTLELRYTTTTRPVREATQMIAQVAWKTIGVKIDIVNLSTGFFGPSGALCTGAFDLGEFSNAFTPDPDDHTFFSSDQTCSNGGGNYMRYSNPQVDELEKAQLATADQNMRLMDFKQIHKLVLQDAPVFYLYSTTAIFCATCRLQLYQPAPIGATETWNVWDWWLKSRSAANPVSIAYTDTRADAAGVPVALGIPITSCHGY